METPVPSHSKGLSRRDSNKPDFVRATVTHSMHNNMDHQLDQVLNHWSAGIERGAERLLIEDSAYETAM
jgi:hypothetical protein